MNRLLNHSGKACFFALLMAFCAFSCKNNDTSPISLTYIGDVYLNTQSAVNEFTSQGYSKVIGNVRIGTKLSGEIADINSLDIPSLETIEGLLEISQTNLSNLNGLSSLQEITGPLHILANNNLSNLDGLQNLQSINALNISENESLENFDQLSAINAMFSVEIISNESLTSINGLRGLNSIPGNLDIVGNPQLTQLTGLESLQTVERQFNLVRNGLLSLSGLESLTSIQFMEVSANDNLVNLNGLENLNNIGAGLLISENPFLSDFCKLEDLMENNQTSSAITIKNNQYNPTAQNFEDGDCSN